MPVISPRARSLLCFAGIALTAILVARRVPGAIILGIAVITVVGLVRPGRQGRLTVTTMPGSLFSLPASPAPVFLKLTFHFLTSWAAFSTALPLILTLLLVDMFDNIGTLVAVTKRAGLLAPDGTLPRAGRALLADSIATIISSLLGTSTVVSYIESASGVEAGGRTGLTGATTAVLFLLALFLTPVILAIPAAATAPALVIVGVFMFQSVARDPEAGRLQGRRAGRAEQSSRIPLTLQHRRGHRARADRRRRVLALGLGKPKSLTTVGYIVAAVFLPLQFFRIWPFSG